MSKTDYNTVDVAVGAETYTLLFTLKAVKRIERTQGGLLPAMQQVQQFNLAAIVAVIAAGAGLSLKPSEVEALEEEIYQAGIITVTPSLIEYLSGLLNPAAKTADQQEQAESAGTKVKK